MEIALLLLTILLNAGCAGLVTHRLNISKERLSFKAAKAEEIYCVTDQLECALTHVFASSYSLIDGHNHHESEVPSETTEAIGHDFSRLKMLIGFYFPALRSSLAHVTSATSSSYAMLHAYQKAAKQEKEQAAQILDTSVVDLKDAFDAMKANILDVGEQEQAAAKLLFFRRRAERSATGRIISLSI